MKTLIDSGPLIALFDRSDEYHQRALTFIKGFAGTLHTTLAVATEVSYMLDFSAACQFDFMTWVGKGALTIESIVHHDLLRMAELHKKYADLPADFADLSLIVVAEKLRLTHIASVDRDFSIYRPRHIRKLVNVF